MAIYYINVQIIGRSAGRTATGAAAYRAGERIVDERTGQVFDYTRRQGDIETQILAPDGAPAWAYDREQLWNHVEAAERRGDAQLAREIVVAFPVELNPDQQRELIREYVQSQFVSQGMAADVAIHRNPGNPHAHIMLTMREIGPEGFAAKKNREWNKPELLERWREQWAVEANRALERAGREERIDHRSLAEQGAERLPQVHLGPHAAALERQGVPTEKGEHNRLVAEHNAVVVDLEKARAERQALQVEKAIQDRTAARVRAGWLPEHAQALGRLEAGAGGGELTETDLRQQRTASEAGLWAVGAELGGIRDEAERLNFAGAALSRHQEALNELQAHETLFGKAKRWFSPDARVAFNQAQERVTQARAAVDRWGVTDTADLARRQEALEEMRTRVPALESKAEALKGTLGVIDKALEGFTRAAQRERLARELQQQGRAESIQRERYPERSRDRGWDRGR